MASYVEQTEQYPSLLWVVIPSILLISAYYARTWYNTRQLKVHGIGKGAPGFQTNVRQIRVTPDIAARLRRGEQVSPEEIARAASLAERAASLAERAEKNNNGVKDRARGVSKVNVEDSQPDTGSEWLPDTITKPKKRSKGKRA